MFYKTTLKLHIFELIKVFFGHGYSILFSMRLSPVKRLEKVSLAVISLHLCFAYYLVGELSSTIYHKITTYSCDDGFNLSYPLLALGVQSNLSGYMLKSENCLCKGLGLL